VTAPEVDVEYLDVDDLISLAVDLLGDPPPIRDAGLLSAAAGRPQASVFGEDAYPDLWTKVAALMHSIVKNHPLVDGNKRLGWLATAVFLELNGVAVTHIANDEVYELVIGVTTGSDDVEAIAAALRSAVEA
jgi:death-on-curing protein